jgi:Arc/MetJ family transcription regulator
MRTNIVIDDALMAQAMQATGISTKREAVERGLQILVRLAEQAELRSLRGAIGWNADLDAMRRDS